jgi:hypothetical protein
MKWCIAEIFLILKKCIVLNKNKIFSKFKPNQIAEEYLQILRMLERPQSTKIKEFKYLNILPKAEISCIITAHFSYYFFFELAFVLYIYGQARYSGTGNRAGFRELSCEMMPPC